MPIRVGGPFLIAAEPACGDFGFVWLGPKYVVLLLALQTLALHPLAPHHAFGM
jgi:hypothetical protein